MSKETFFKAKRYTRNPSIKFLKTTHIEALEKKYMTGRLYSSECMCIFATISHQKKIDMPLCHIKMSFCPGKSTLTPLLEATLLVHQELPNSVPA